MQNGRPPGESEAEFASQNAPLQVLMLNMPFENIRHTFEISIRHLITLAFGSV